MKTSITLRAVLVVLASAVIVLDSCHSRPSPENIVVVRVFRDSNSAFRPELDRKLWEFNDHKYRVASGKYILAATMETTDYRKDLAQKVAQFKPQLVVLDSPADVSLVPEFTTGVLNAKNACTGETKCPAFIPDWVHGEELEGARKLLDWTTSQS